VGYDCAPLYLNQAGERRYASRMLSELQARSDIAVASLSPPPRRPQTMLQRVALQGMIQTLYYPLGLGHQASRAGVDLVHHPRHLVPPTYGQRAPTAITVHDVLPLRQPRWFSPAIIANFRLLAPGAARRAAVVLTGSEHSRGEIAELLGVPADRIRVTPYGVDERFRPQPPAPGLLRERFGIDRPYVLCVSTLEPRKNLAAAIRAFALLSKRETGVALVTVGARGWGSTGLGEEIAQVRAPVVQTGFVSDAELVALLSGASCFLYPSLAEGFGFPPLEAMACGTPVVCSNRTSLPEVVGDAALLVDPDDLGAMVDALQRVLSSAELAADLRVRGLRHSRGYRWSDCAEKTVAAYRAVLGA